MYRLLLDPRLFFFPASHCGCDSRALWAPAKAAKLASLCPLSRASELQNKPLSGAALESNHSDLLPVIKAHPGHDPRDQRKECGSWGELVVGGALCGYLLYI